jgi:hypothetical protein
LNWVLLRVVIGDPQRFEFFWEEIVKLSGEGGETVAVASLGGLPALYFFDSAAGIVAVT